MIWERDRISYLAGLFDGEGCVYIAHHKGGRGGNHSYTKLRMIISNTNKEVIDWLLAEFGGWCQMFDCSKKNPKWKTRYNWWIEGDRAKQLLMLIYPHCIIKRAKIESRLNLTPFPPESKQ